MGVPLDRRRRTAADVRDLPPARFFENEFLEFAAENGGLVADAMGALGARPLTIKVADDHWTIELSGSTISSRRGIGEDALLIELGAKHFSDLMQNLISLNWLVSAKVLRVAADDMRQLSLWDSLILTLIAAWPTVPADLGFTDRHGQPIDLEQSFAPDAHPDDIAHFLREAGYLRLRGWLDTAGMSEIVRDMDEARPRYSEGDGQSWWATLSSGKRFCVRQQYFERHSAAVRRLMRNDGWDRLRAAIGGKNDRVVFSEVGGRNVQALTKPPGVASGPSDLGLHRDCHLGRHLYECSHMTIGIPLTSANKGEGHLQVVAGSHRVALPVAFARTAPYLPIIDLECRPGDLSVHLSCTLHGSVPPRSAPRRVMYMALTLTGVADLHGGGLRELRSARSDLFPPKGT